jgi:ATP phosphoribosyltransferase
MTVPSSADVSTIRLALPSKGSLGDGAAAIMKSAGFKVLRASDRQYVATISGQPRFEVVFMRPSDIVSQVRDGLCHLGVTGLDLFEEYAGDDPSATVVIDNLGYGDCRLVVAVPESWIDVSHVIDLVDLSFEFRSSGKALRISTKYPNLTARFLSRWGIYHYQLIDSEGALELHPTLGIADVIIDLTSSGTTLRENRLREVQEGTVLKSAACLIGHVPSLEALVAEGESGPLAHWLDALDGVRAAEGWLHLEVAGDATQCDDVSSATAIVAEFERLGAKHVAQGHVWGPDHQPGWTVSALVSPKGLPGLRRKLLRLGATRVVGLPPRFVYEVSTISTFDRLREKRGPRCYDE